MRTPPEFAFNIHDHAVKANPYPLIEEMRATGRVISNPYFLGQLMVPGYDDVIALLNDPETFGNGNLGSGGPATGILQARTMLNADPPDHERLRGPVSRAFTPRSVARLEQGMHDTARKLVAPLADGAEYDIVASLGEQLPVLVIAEMLGVGTADLDDFAKWSHGLLGVLDMFAPPEQRAHAKECSRLLHEYFADAIALRRDKPTADDLIGRFLAANQDGQLSDPEMLSACVLLLLGGNETTTKLITNAALALVRNPDQRARLVADPSLIATAVDEVLRYDTPVQGNSRVASRDTEFAGYDIGKGTVVVGLLSAANRDPDRFEAPANLDIGRSPNLHLSFSRGIHFCLGANLARLEAQAAILALLDVAPDYELAMSEDELEYGPTYFFHAPGRLAIRKP